MPVLASVPSPRPAARRRRSALGKPAVSIGLLLAAAATMAWSAGVMDIWFVPPRPPVAPPSAEILRELQRQNDASESQRRRPERFTEMGA